jgi:hypothetical protein
VTVIDPDVLAAAQLLSRRYGSEAKRHALQRIWELAFEGDLMGRDLWVQVADVIDELQSQSMTTGVHPRIAP